MENKFKEKLRELNRSKTALLEECLNTIQKTVASYPNKTLKFGNTILKVFGVFEVDTTGRHVKELATFISVNHGPFIRLYGEDDYTTLDDIAHWADVVTDVDNYYKAGNKAYAMDWEK